MMMADASRRCPNFNSIDESMLPLAAVPVKNLDQQTCYQAIHNDLHLRRQPNDDEDWRCELEGRDTVTVDVR